MNKPVGQHLVAKFILKKFADPNGFLHCFHKPSDRIFSAKPEQAIRENHIYTLSAGNETKPYAIEEDLGKLESELAPTLQKVIEVARSGHFPAPSPEEEEILRIYLWVQLRKTRTARDILRASLQQDQSETYHDDWRNSLAVAIDAETRAVVFNKGLVFGVIKDSQSKALAIGDHPVILGGAGEYPITHPKAEISMPVASDVLMSLHGARSHRQLLPIDHIADLVNDGVLVYSDTVATGCLEGTQELRRRWHDIPDLAELARTARQDTGVQGKT